MDQEEEQYSCLEEFFIDSCRYGDYEDAIGCFEDNVDLSWYDDRLNNCIHMTSANGHLNILQKIIQFAKQYEQKYKIQDLVNHQNQDGNTPLHWAVINSQTEIIKYLMELGADTGIKNNFRRTPLDEAIALEKSDISDLLAGTTKADLNDYANIEQVGTEVNEISNEDLEDIDVDNFEQK